VSRDAKRGLAGAKAPIFFADGTARLKSCPDAGQLRLVREPSCFGTESSCPDAGHTYLDAESSLLEFDRARDPR
jgi:hypothetical protein